MPRIEVVAETPPEPVRKPGRPSLAQRLALIERAIVDAELVVPEPVSRPSPRPLLIDLHPSSRLSPRAARLDRLIRSMLVDKGLLRGEPLHKACLRVGERQAPAAGSALVADAVQWLEPWLAAPVFQELRDASRARRPIGRNVDWSLAWPQCGAASTVFRGCTEAIYRDSQGRWRPLIVSTFASESEYERLRLMLSTAAAIRTGFDPAGPCWWVHFDANRNIIVDVQIGFQASAIEQSLAQCLPAVDHADVISAQSFFTRV